MTLSSKLLRKVLLRRCLRLSSTTSTGWPASCSARSRARHHRHRLGHHDGELLQPGRAGKTGIDAGAPILEQIGDMAGFPEVFANLDPIVVMFLPGWSWCCASSCWRSSFSSRHRVQADHARRVRAGAVHALWNKTSIPRRKGAGNVCRWHQVLVLAVIVGIGSACSQFQVHPPSRTSTTPLVIMLPRSPCWRSDLRPRHRHRALCPARPSSARARWPGAAVGAVGNGVAMSVLPRPAWAVLSNSWRAWPRLPPSWPAPARVPPRRRLAARSRRSRPVPPPPAAVPKARWLAWAMSPRPARSLAGPPLPHPALRLPGSVAGSFRAGWNGDRRWRVSQPGRPPAKRRHGAPPARLSRTHLGKADASPPAALPRRDHRRPRAARWRRRRLGKGPSLRSSDD